jgi:hypothetical protein
MYLFMFILFLFIILFYFLFFFFNRNCEITGVQKFGIFVEVLPGHEGLLLFIIIIYF